MTPALPRSIAADAVVLDHGRRHEGHAGSPIRFTYRFTREPDAITALEIAA